jgi:lipooligosaccharide transport system ATP-binding protein
MDHGVIIALDTPRGLIAQSIEPQVVEVFGDGAREWACDVAPKYVRRIEVAGETAFCYADDAGPLLETVSATPSLRALKRAANLEDVFIKLTGRDIRD